MIRTVRCLLALIRPPFRCSTVPLQARTRNGTTTATLRVIYPATNLGPGRATQLGDGDVPVIDALRLLHAAGYDGYLTLEWEKAWQDYLPDPSEGFPQYVKQIKQYLAEIT